MKKLLFILLFASLTIIANAQWQPTGLDSTCVRSLVIKGDTLFAGSQGYGIYLSTNNGSTWHEVNTGLTGNALWVGALTIKGDTLFAGTDNGVFLSSNNGNSWSAAGLTSYHILSFTISGNNIFAGTYYNNDVFLSSNDGSSWNVVNNGLPANVGIWAMATSGNNIFAETDNGVYLSSNNGQLWTEDTVLIDDGGARAFAVKGDTIFAGGNIGVYLSSNYGSSWTTVNNGLPANPYISTMTLKGNNIFAGGTFKGVFISSNNGSNWASTGLLNDTIWVLAITGDTLFAGINTGGVWMLPLATVGIKEINNNKSNIAIYPNPAKDILTIESLQKSTIEILNIQGQAIIQQTIQQGRTDIDISGLAKGVYILRQCSNDKTEVTRIVKE